MSHDAPQSNLFGNDIVNHWNLGFELFNDKDRFHVPYIESDLLYPTEELWKLHACIDIISITHVLHQIHLLHISFVVNWKSTQERLKVFNFTDTVATAYQPWKSDHNVH
jgi:hypothetical protein